MAGFPRPTPPLDWPHPRCAGKLFPGPHLYAGMAITVLWALAAAMVPPMQKGNEVARSLHITFNALNVLLFISQASAGRGGGWEGVGACAVAGRCVR